MLFFYEPYAWVCFYSVTVAWWDASGAFDIVAWGVLPTFPFWETGIDVIPVWRLGNWNIRRDPLVFCVPVRYELLCAWLLNRFANYWAFSSSLVGRLWYTIGRFAFVWSERRWFLVFISALSLVRLFCRSLSIVRGDRVGDSAGVTLMVALLSTVKVNLVVPILPALLHRFVTSRSVTGRFNMLLTLCTLVRIVFTP